MKQDTSTHFKQSSLLPWVEMRVANQSDACYAAHSHDEFSFGMIEQGAANYKNRHRSHETTAGDIVTINPADLHSCNPKAGLWSYSMLFVDALKMGEIQRDLVSLNARQKSVDYIPFRHDLERSPLIRKRFVALFGALLAAESELQAEQALYDFVAACFWQQAPVAPNLSHVTVLKRVRDKMCDELNTLQSLESLANEAGMSRYQFIRAFRHQFGQPPYAYLIDEKIKRSKAMLRQGQSISEVALSLGFADQAHFQRNFKKKLAVTPKYYQSHFV